MEYIGLENFRNHTLLSVNIKSNAKIIGFIGQNGCGKTNILEALSLIDGSRGLKKANISTMQNNNAHDGFKIHLEIDGDKITLQNIGGKKVFFLNGVKQKTFYEISQIVATIWSCPELEYLFFSSESTKRDFFDKMTFSFFNNHYKLLLEAEKLIKERLRILTSDSNYDKTLDFVESELSSKISQIIINRFACINAIQKDLDEILITQEFLHFKSSQDIPEYSLLNDIVVKKLLESRIKDKFSESTSFSHQKIKTHVVFNSKDFVDFSSGQAKFVLIKICFAFAKSIKKLNKNINILFLLDDFFAKLDVKSSKHLLEMLERWNDGHVVITSTGNLSTKEDDNVYHVIYL
jgi:DNA replication and repair protein RecF